MRKGTTVFAALAAAAFVATPLVIGTTGALATSEPAEPAAHTAQAASVEVAPAQVAAPAACRKVRVVYGGYADASAACVAAR